MKTWIKTALASVTALGVGVVMLGHVAKADDAPIASYGVDIVSDYVVRGVDQYDSAFAFHKKDATSFNVSPSLQPTLTLFGPSGLSLNLWGAFALTDRADDNKKGFTGLSKLDELDYTLAYDWSNRMGGFTAAIIQYTYLYATGGSNVTPDYMIKWAMPFASSVSPYFAYYANETPGAEYATLGFSGGSNVFWAASLGEKSKGPSDVTAKVGYNMGPIALSVNAAYRPTPAIASNGYTIDSKGKYTDFDGKSKTFPSTIMWLDIGYSGSVAAK